VTYQPPSLLDDSLDVLEAELVALELELLLVPLLLDDGLDDDLELAELLEAELDELLLELLELLELELELLVAELLELLDDSSSYRPQIQTLYSTSAPLAVSLILWLAPSVIANPDASG
jgi:hypothetical protein